MPRLMIATPDPDPQQPLTRTGGRPLAPPTLAWPTCRRCQGPMQFVAQIRLSDAADPALPDGLLLVFLCQNNPGVCEEWDANAGGNHARVVPVHGLHLLSPPEGGETLLKETYGASLVELASDSYGGARGDWAARSGRSPRDVLGQVGGQPQWLQLDDTPVCSACGQAMRFVAQLEEGPRYETSINFGGGAGFAFACVACLGEAKFLWQQ